MRSDVVLYIRTTVQCLVLFGPVFLQSPHRERRRGGSLLIIKQIIVRAERCADGSVREVGSSPCTLILLLLSNIGERLAREEKERERKKNE